MSERPNAATYREWLAELGRYALMTLGVAFVPVAYTLLSADVVPGRCQSPDGFLCGLLWAEGLLIGSILDATAVMVLALVVLNHRRIVRRIRA